MRMMAYYVLDRLRRRLIIIISDDNDGLLRLRQTKKTTNTALRR